MNFLNIKMFYICTIIRKSTEAIFMGRNLLYTIILSFTLSSLVSAQRHEIGIQMGISNLVGDIGRTEYLFQPFIDGDFSQVGYPFYGGILYRMNFNPYQSVRASFGYNHIQFSDLVAKEYYRQNRGLRGTNSMMELNVLFEYNFLPINEEQKSMVSPYIFGGIGALLAENPQMVITHDFRRNAAGEAQEPIDAQDFATDYAYEASRKLTATVPFGIGLKYKFNYNWMIFTEVMFRPTFSDSIDYSVIDKNSIKNLFNKDILDETGAKSLLQTGEYYEEAQRRSEALRENRQVGNINSKDWVNSFTLGLTYSFGRPPCYCEE